MLYFPFTTCFNNILIVKCEYLIKLMDSFVHSEIILNVSLYRARGPLLVCSHIHLKYASAPGPNITYLLLA